MALLQAAADHAQKKTAHAAEQDRPDILKRRQAWFDGQLDLDPERLVFIDETWASTNLARLRGRAPKGERLRAAIPHGHWKTTTWTVLKTGSIDGISDSIALGGSELERCGANGDCSTLMIG